eukprot:Selendium_serpulae@DN6063_c0_g1_i3.p1
MKELDTYYIYNRDGKCPWYPFHDVYHDIKKDYNLQCRGWNNDSRFSVAVGSKPWVQFRNKSQYAKDYMAKKGVTDDRVLECKQYLQISYDTCNGNKWIEFKFLRHEYFPDTYVMRQKERSKNMHLESGFIHSDFPSDGIFQDEKTSWTLIRLYGDTGFRCNVPTDEGIDGIHKDRTPPPADESWDEKGTWSLINVEHNIGVVFDGAELKGQNYGKDSKNWHEVNSFKRYSSTFFVSSPSMNHKIKVKDIDGIFNFMKIKDDKYVSGEENRYRITATEIFDEGSVFQIRRSGIDDKMDGSPFWVTAQHNGKTVVLIVEDENDNIGGVHMREESSDPGTKANFYLEDEVDLSSANAAWDHIK